MAAAEDRPLSRQVSRLIARGIEAERRRQPEEVKP
jgi:hypothetical protein